MDRSRLGRQMTAEQFAMFDTQLYLDTHPNDMVAMNMFNSYKKAHDEYKKQFEAQFGPLTAEGGAPGESWAWVRDPWPWEREAN